MTPSVPGIYIVQPTNVEPKCMYTGDSRREGKGVMVNNTNVKFGIAVNLNNRLKSYKHFDPTFAHIFPLPNLSKTELQAIENKIKADVDSFRCVNPNSGRKAEWCNNITPDQLKIIIESHI